MLVTSNDDLTSRALTALAACGVPKSLLAGTGTARSAITGQSLCSAPETNPTDVGIAIADAHAAFLQWRRVPAPVRGTLVKRLGQLLTENKEALADLITIEVGKIRSEALGEVQEMIDICDFAVGLSRQVGGITIPSERPEHRLMETWHPLGAVAVISAFNFPAAVWAWNAALALICGNTVLWKPSEMAPLTALACHHLLAQAADATGAPANLNVLVMTDALGAAALLDDPRVRLVSATGSERMGRAVAPRVAARFGRLILELGGNNAAIVTPSADLDLAVRGITFAAAGTAGQRCTTLRRLIVHEDVAHELLDRLCKVYEQLPVGDPLDDSTLVGPLIHAKALRDMDEAIGKAIQQGGALIVGGTHVPSPAGGSYVRPAIVRMPTQTEIVRTETFAPVLYVLTYRDLDQAIAMHNDVPQGLSSSIFTRDQREAEQFLASDGSDCGIANVNIGTSGAEIGGAFGGEKSTGGGRESGSDSWKAYMRRATNTINYSTELPLAQGVSFA